MAAQWEQLLHKVKEIRGKSNGLLFDRTKLLVAIWNDGEYLAFHGGDIDKAEAYLDAEVGDYGLTFFDVKAIYENFPKRDAWTAGKLREMLATALQKAAEARRERSRESGVEAPRTVHRIAKKELDAAVTERDTAIKRSEFLGSEVESLRNKVAELSEENRRLTAELARAEGRIAELERFAKRELSAA